MTAIYNEKLKRVSNLENAVRLLVERVDALENGADLEVAAPEEPDEVELMMSLPYSNQPAGFLKGMLKKSLLLRIFLSRLRLVNYLACSDRMALARRRQSRC